MSGMSFWVTPLRLPAGAVLVDPPEPKSSTRLSVMRLSIFSYPFDLGRFASRGGLFTSLPSVSPPRLRSTCPSKVQRLVYIPGGTVGSLANGACRLPCILPYHQALQRAPSRETQ